MDPGGLPGVAHLKANVFLSGYFSDLDLIMLFTLKFKIQFYSKISNFLPPLGIGARSLAGAQTPGEGPHENLIHNGHLTNGGFGVAAPTAKLTVLVDERKKRLTLSFIHAPSSPSSTLLQPFWGHIRASKNNVIHAPPHTHTHAP